MQTGLLLAFQSNTSTEAGPATPEPEALAPSIRHIGSVPLSAALTEIEAEPVDPDSLRVTFHFAGASWGQPALGYVDLELGGPARIVVQALPTLVGWGNYTLDVGTPRERLTLKDSAILNDNNIPADIRGSCNLLTSTTTGVAPLETALPAGRVRLGMGYRKSSVLPDRLSFLVQAI